MNCRDGVHVNTSDIMCVWGGSDKLTVEGQTFEKECSSGWWRVDNSLKFTQLLNEAVRYGPGWASKSYYWSVQLKAVDGTSVIVIPLAFSSTTLVGFSSDNGTLFWMGGGGASCGTSAVAMEMEHIAHTYVGTNCNVVCGTQSHHVSF